MSLTFFTPNTNDVAPIFTTTGIDWNDPIIRGMKLKRRVKYNDKIFNWFEIEDANRDKVIKAIKDKQDLLEKTHKEIKILKKDLKKIHHYDFSRFKRKVDEGML